MPTFETGRLAGLGLDPAGAPGATASAWADYPGREAGARFCYYHRWYFRTGNVGDFEYLVRLLEPRAVDPRVGQRDMDVQRPGANLPGILDPALAGVLRLGGALRVPQSSLNATELAETQKYENWNQPSPHAFQVSLADLVNLARRLCAAAMRPIPIRSSPRRCTASGTRSRTVCSKRRRCGPPRRRTGCTISISIPRFRVAAAFGTGVVQKNQEEYMAAAWNQIGAVLEANRRIRLAHLAREVARRWHVRHLAPQLVASPGRLLELTAPLQRRVLADGVTVAHRVATSAVGFAPMSAAMRRMVRPGARFMQRLGRRGDRSTGALLERLARVIVTAARPKTFPGGVATTRELVDRLRRVLEQRGLGDRAGLFDERRRSPVARRQPSVATSIQAATAGAPTGRSEPRRARQPRRRPVQGGDARQRAADRRDGEGVAGTARVHRCAFATWQPSRSTPFIRIAPFRGARWRGCRFPRA